MTQPLLSIDGVAKQFRAGGRTIHALSSIDLDVGRAESVGLVGESGCGKSTLGKAALRLLPVSAGQIRFDGVDLLAARRRPLLALRARMQMVFQDPGASLNPRSTVQRTLEEPLIVHRRGDAPARRAAALRMLDRVGLPAALAGRHSEELSGGQRQRVAIARALMLEPELIVCDEPVSALDVSVRAQILNLIMALQRERGIALLFISHDLSVVRHVAQRVVVMYLGRIVEIAEPEALWRSPLHPYSRALIEAVPIADPTAARRRRHRTVQGELPSPLAPPSGCAFHPRCPKATERCRIELPVLRPRGGGRHAACHLIPDDA